MGVEPPDLKLEHQRCRLFEQTFPEASHLEQPTLPLIDAVQNELFRRGFLEEYPADSGCERCKPAMSYCLGLPRFLVPQN